MDESNRFDRIEVKIDKLTDAVASIARVEEKIIASNDRMAKVEKTLGKAETDIDSLYKMVRENSGVVRFIDKIFWVVFGTVAGVVAWYVKK